MENTISFFNEEIKFKLDNKKEITKWLLGVIIDNNKYVEFINYIFCSDEYLYKINLEQLNHDTYTDIITFQYNEENEPLESDIYISIDRIKDNANTFNVSFEEELHRVLIHGVLHLIGFKDKTDKDQIKMTEMENKYLGQISFVPRGTKNKD